MDLFSRKIVGWAMRDRMQVELASEALTMAIQQQRPQAGLIHHSDRGVQYASHAYRKGEDQTYSTGAAGCAVTYSGVVLLHLRPDPLVHLSPMHAQQRG
jgi:transposase InsO family protein